MRSEKLWGDFCVFMPHPFRLLIEIMILLISQVSERSKLKHECKVPSKLKDEEVIPYQYEL